MGRIAATTGARRMNYFRLIPILIALGLTGLCAFFWSLRHDQYEDLAGAARRILIAPDKPVPTPPGPQNPAHPSDAVNYS